MAPREGGAAATWLARLLLVAVVVALFAPIAFDRVVALRDLPRFTLPDRAAWAESIRAGELPVWSPAVGLGVPLTAAPVHGSFYPGNLLLLPDAPLGLMVLFALHALLAGLGGLALARRLGARPAAAAIAGLVLTVGGYAISMWGDGEKVLSGAYLPWVALGWVALAGRRARVATGVVLAALPLGLMALAGDPFLWLDAGLLALPLALATRAVDRRVVLGRLAAAVGLALVLAAPALVPAVAGLAESERAGGLARASAEAWSTAPRDLLGLFVPGFAHSADPSLGSAWAPSLYLGLAALAALAAPGGPVRRALWLAGGLGAVLALGRFTPVHGWLHHLPPLSWTRYPEKHLAVTTAALALLAALGWERLAARATPRLGAGRARHALWLVATVAAIDLAIAAGGELAWLDAEELRTPPAAVTALVAGHAPTEPPPRLYRPRVADPSMASVPDNLGTLWGVAHVPGHDPALPARLHALWDALAPRGERAMQLLGIDAALLPGPRGFELHRVAPPPPRAWTVDRAVVLDDAAALRRLAAPEFALTDEVVLAPGGAAPVAGRGAAGRCHFVAFAAAQLAVDCELERAGFAVISEGWAPGWRATVDGEGAEIRRADLVLRAVAVGAGRHRIVMTYRAPGLGPGLGAGGAGWLAAVGLVAWDRRRRGRPG